MENWRQKIRNTVPMCNPECSGECEEPVIRAVESLLEQVIEDIPDYYSPGIINPSFIKQKLKAKWLENL